MTVLSSLNEIMIISLSLVKVKLEVPELVLATKTLDIALILCKYVSRFFYIANLKYD